jgi:hypothetical protein
MTQEQRQEMMKAMLQDFARKKDKVLMDKFKQNQLLAASLSSFPGANREIPKRVAGKVLAAKKQKPEMREQVKMVIVDSETCEHRPAKFNLGKYRHACTTCKVMRDYQAEV